MSFIIVSIITLLLYHPMLVAFKMLDMRHMVDEARKLNPADAHKVVPPFGWRWAIKCVYLYLEHPPLRTRWYVYYGTSYWQVWEHEPHV